jgi:thiol-disulfide isomerase/thioredoxin
MSYYNDKAREYIEPKQFDSLLSSGKKTLVMFYADWCAFCEGFKPTFESAVKKCNYENGIDSMGIKLMIMEVVYGIGSR